MSIKTFIKSKEVEEAWCHYGEYDEKGEFIVKESFGSDDPMAIINSLNEYKLAEDKDIVRDTSEGKKEFRFFFYLNEYETDYFDVTEDNFVFSDVYTVKRSYTPHDSTMFEDLAEKYLTEK